MRVWAGQPGSGNAPSHFHQFLRDVMRDLRGFLDHAALDDQAGHIIGRRQPDAFGEFLGMEGHASFDGLVLSGMASGSGRR